MPGSSSGSLSRTRPEFNCGGGGGRGVEKGYVETSNVFLFHDYKLLSVTIVVYSKSS